MTLSPCCYAYIALKLKVATHLPSTILVVVFMACTYCSTKTFRENEEPFRNGGKTIFYDVAGEELK
jgi:hypothetical protein